MEKHHDKGNLRTREFTLACGSRGIGVHGGNRGVPTSDRYGGSSGKLEAGTVSWRWYKSFNSEGPPSVIYFL